ncbi:hypothetical protein SESBI_08331 [Sesbania bispinosa]|nr:hypothetical protein SESBI_08331 [Sesbania bispinosa]
MASHHKIKARSFNSMADLLRPRSTLRGPEATFNILNIQIGNMAVETNPLHALVAFIFFVLLGFLQIRYPQNPTPFEVHPKTMVDVATTHLGIIGFHYIHIMVHCSHDSSHDQNPFHCDMA